MKFEDIEVGMVLYNRRTGQPFKIEERISEHVYSMISLKYIGKRDFVNRATAEDYDVKN